MSQLTAAPAQQDVGAGASYKDRSPDRTESFPQVDAKDMIVDYMESPMASESTRDSLNETLRNLQVMSFDSSPSQVPFDDPTIGPLSRPSRYNIAIPAPQPGRPSPVESATTNSKDSEVMGGQGPYSNGQLHSTTSLQQPQRPRPELLHATRSSPGPRIIADLDGFALHDESPFEAARRAQRIAQSTESLQKQAQAQERKFIPGRVPSIKPGDIMPDYLIPLLHGPPTFAPPLDAPPFPPFRPPVVHPIHAAHFPAEPGHTQAAFIPSPSPQPSPYPPGPNQQYLQPPLPLPPPQVPLNGLYTASQPADMSRSPQPVQPQQQAQLLRSPSHAHNLPPPANGQTSPKSQSPNPTRRHTYDPHRGALGQPSVPNENYPPPPMPLPQDMSQGLVSSRPLSRSASQHHISRPSPPLEVPPLPMPPRHSPPPLSTRDSSRQSLRPSPLRSEFAPAPAPIRLPSENMGFRAPVTANRSTPKPVMPPLLAPRASENNNASRSAPHLQRSMSSGQEKGGFLSKTKSLLRKRSSASGLKLRADGGISFAPPMHTVQEEDGKPGKKLNKRK